MSVQLILKEGQPEYAIIPYETYMRLVEDAEMLADIRDYDAARQSVAEGKNWFRLRSFMRFSTGATLSVFGANTAG